MKRLLKTFQFHVLWVVTPRKFWASKPSVDEKDFSDLLAEFKPFEVVFVQVYIKRETRPGDLALILLQKNSTGCHVDPKLGKLEFKSGVIFYKEVQKTQPDKVFEGDNFQLVYSERPFINEKDSLNVNFKASNSNRRPRGVDFLFTLGINTFTSK